MAATSLTCFKRSNIPHTSDTIVLGEKKSASGHYYMDLLEPGSSSDFPGRVLGNDDTELEQGRHAGMGPGTRSGTVRCNHRRDRTFAEAGVEAEIHLAGASEKHADPLLHRPAGLTFACVEFGLHIDAPTRRKMPFQACLGLPIRGAVAQIGGIQRRPLQHV